MDTARPLQKDVARRLAQAEAACATRGARLTDIRRDVLSLILEADSPIGGYALLDRLRTIRPSAVPPTVYRALDFLLAQGLIHKVERLNAYIGCIEADAHGHPVQFLICQRCGSATEIEDAAVARAVTAAATRTGFRPVHTTVEVEGICAACLARS
jgi:Fur family zinc uptake transcriptional regulator